MMSETFDLLVKTIETFRPKFYLEEKRILVGYGTYVTGTSGIRMWLILPYLTALIRY